MDNYLALAEAAGLTSSEVVTLAENSFTVSWLDEDRLAGYLDELRRFVSGFGPRQIGNRTSSASRVSDKKETKNYTAETSGAASP